MSNNAEKGEGFGKGVPDYTSQNTSPDTSTICLPGFQTTVHPPPLISKTYCTKELPGDSAKVMIPEAKSRDSDQEPAF